jgi:proteasome lid subunit RPN8/RPN11
MERAKAGPYIHILAARYKLGLMAGVVRVRAEILDRLLAEARHRPEIECCGLLGGRAGVISAVFPAHNTLSSPTAFEIAPEELFRLFREMRAAGLELLGIYHSHPAGSNAPSARDIERAYYPEAAYFIISPHKREEKTIRAFSIRDASVSELTIETV